MASISVSQAIQPKFEQMAHVMLTTTFDEAYVYADGKRTDKIDGYRADFLVMTGDLAGLTFTAKFEKLPANLQQMQQYRMKFDAERTKVYVRQGQIGMSVWATELEPLAQSQK